MIIQIIGLPCAGKTTAINKYILTREDIAYVDIATFEGERKQINFSNTVRRRGAKNTHVIAESACGISLKENDIIIKMTAPMGTVYKRVTSRKDADILTPNYLSQLESQMLPAKFTVSDEEGLFLLLDALLGS